MPGDDGWIVVRGARTHNLQNVDVKIPRGKFVVVSGVSGSGKSTLVNEIIKKSIYKQLNIGRHKPGKCKAVKGAEHIDKMIVIFEFEHAWYKKRGVESRFVGHPFLDIYNNNSDLFDLNFSEF